MKKLLALLLAGLMLMGFGVGVNAETPEELEAEENVSQEIQEPEAEEFVPQATQEELEAEGRALLAQTMEDFKGDFTSGSIVHSGGTYAIILSDGTRELYLNGQIYRVYPDRKAYRKLESSSNANRLRYYEPREITEDTPITARMIYGSDDVLEVKCNGFTYRYIDTMGIFVLQGFRKEANLSLLSLEGFREISERRVTLWDFSDMYWGYYWQNFLSIAWGAFPTNIFMNYLGIPMYPFALLFFFGGIIIAPAMLIIRLILPLIP